MVDIEMLFHGVVLLSGIIGALGTGYLLYDDSIVVHYTSFFGIITAGLFIFAVTAPIIVFLAPGFIHAIHAISALFISIGLYTLIREQLDTEPDFEQFNADLFRDEEH